VKALGLSLTKSKVEDTGSPREQVEKCMQMLLYRELSTGTQQASLRLPEKLVALREEVRVLFLNFFSRLEEKTSKMCFFSGCVERNGVKGKNRGYDWSIQRFEGKKPVQNDTRHHQSTSWWARSALEELRQLDPARLFVPTHLKGMKEERLRFCRIWPPFLNFWLFFRHCRVKNSRVKMCNKTTTQ